MNIYSYADKFFDGDLDKSLENLAKEVYSEEYKTVKNKKELDDILEPLERDLALKYLEYLKIEINKNPKRYHTVMKDAFVFNMMDFSYEEIQNAKVNPYGAKLKKEFLKLLIFDGGLILATLMANNFGLGDLVSNIINGAAVMLNGYLASEIGIDFVKYCNFKKLQKKYKYDDLENEHKGEMKL